MSKTLSNTVLDAALTVVTTCTRVDIVSDSATPTDLTNTLATTTLTAGDGNGDYTISEGITNGRRVTVTGQASISSTLAGTGKHVVLSVGGTIHLVTTITDTAVAFPGTVTIPTFDHELSDPT